MKLHNAQSKPPIGGGNNGTINYIYDATGVKLRKTVDNTGESSVTITDYAGNYVYEGPSGNTQLQFFSQPEGYIKVDNDQYGYVYQYKDHLGNIRLSFTDDPSNPGTPTIVEENNYYPFGLKHKGYNSGGDSSLGNDAAQRWKFGGKEYQQDMDLNWYDVTARNYDPPPAAARILSCGGRCRRTPVFRDFHVATPQ